MSLAAADKLLKIFDALKNFREGIPVTDPNPLAKWGFLQFKLILIILKCTFYCIKLNLGDESEAKIFLLIYVIKYWDIINY